MQKPSSKNHSTPYRIDTSTKQASKQEVAVITMPKSTASTSAAAKKPSSGTPDAAAAATNTTEKRLKRFRSSCPAAIRQRIDRAKTQQLFLIRHELKKDEQDHSCEFTVLGSTGNVYTVMALDSQSSLIYQAAWIGSELEFMFQKLKERFQSLNGGGVLANQAVRAKLAEMEQEGTKNATSTTTSAVARRPAEEGDDCPICFDPLVLSQDHPGSSSSLTFCRGQCGSNFHEATRKSTEMMKVVLPIWVICKDNRLNATQVHIIGLPVVVESDNGDRNTRMPVVVCWLLPWPSAVATVAAPLPLSIGWTLAKLPVGECNLRYGIDERSYCYRKACWEDSSSSLSKMFHPSAGRSLNEGSRVWKGRMNDVVVKKKIADKQNCLDSVVISNDVLPFFGKLDLKDYECTHQPPRGALVAVAPDPCRLASTLSILDFLFPLNLQKPNYSPMSRAYPNS
eukprot:scaffold14886_cov108-Cylindrotheca_fusiformis.AAC.6